VSCIWLYIPLNGESANVKYNQVMDHKYVIDFRAYFHEVYIHGVFWP